MSRRTSNATKSIRKRAKRTPHRKTTHSNGRHANLPKVGCLFAAIGGFCKAFQLAGATVAWANEKDQFARETFVANFPRIRFIHKPIEDLSVQHDRLEPVDILTAGFPCQPFSVAGEKRGFSDERGLLFLHIIRLLREFGEVKPKILLLENVRNFRTHDKGRTFKRIQTEIQKAGYWFAEKDAHILNTAVHTPIPQNRARIFMVAMSCDHFASNTFTFPKPLPSTVVRSVWDFLDTRRKQDPYFYFTDESQYYEPFRQAIEASGKKSIYQLRRSYVRENKSGICFTLMANMGEGGHNQPVIKDRWGIRKLTPRECARLQGYEDSWFTIPTDLSYTQIYKQIGNSVTVPLVAELAQSCLTELAKLDSRNGTSSPRRERRQWRSV
ncbi:MAG TPA: DNA (cytosine-5-)-methyltransferase [Planctomycetaceae bacterium]|jgi:DNA (cytosine-5)-methyltransferase 1|nr:DNA (cytosine-5-)-methyltransferase [Planctomycetaceae bacterium]